MDHEGNLGEGTEAKDMELACSLVQLSYTIRAHMSRGATSYSGLAPLPSIPNQDVPQMCLRDNLVETVAQLIISLPKYI